VKPSRELVSVKALLVVRLVAFKHKLVVRGLTAKLIVMQVETITMYNTFNYIM
jgi:hypothetical protein